MAHYQHELTEIETACGVTLNQVANLLPLVAVRWNETYGEDEVWVARDVAPALAVSTARAALGEPATLAGFARDLGVAIYVPKASVRA